MTPSDSQDGARRRDDAARRHRREMDGYFSPRCQNGMNGCGDRACVCECHVDEYTDLRADVARLEAERAEARTQSEEARHERNLWQGEHAAALGVIEAIKAELELMKADLASLAYWYCANCERHIPDADIQWDEDRDGFCPYSSDQLEWCEPETLTSVKAYAEKLREGKNRAFAERDEARTKLARCREDRDEYGGQAVEAERERDEARARANEAARLSAEARDQADDLRRLIANLREEIAIIDESRTEMTVIQLRLEEERDGYRAESQRLGAKAQQLVRLATDLRAQRDTAIDLLDQLADDDPCDYDHHDYCQTHHLLSRPCATARAIALIAAVDQTAPSSPLETPHTADGGEAGVVEGAGGSEAAEGVVPFSIGKRGVMEGIDLMAALRASLERAKAARVEVPDA